MWWLGAAMLADAFRGGCNPMNSTYPLAMALQEEQTGRGNRLGRPTGRDEMDRITAVVSGQVQGVGFRWGTRNKLADLGLAGGAENLDDGSVRVVAIGDVAALDALIAWLEGPTAPGRVRSVRVQRG